MKRRGRLLAWLGLGAVLIIGAGVWRALFMPPLRPLPATLVPHGTPLPLRPATAAERQAAIASVTSQLQAFRRDDFQRAVFYQSSGLRRHFASVAAFRTMMRTSYPQFVHYKSVQFGAARADHSGLHVVLPATVTGQDGVTVHATYIMVLEQQVYRVDGVAGGLAAPPPPGVTV